MAQPLFEKVAFIGLGLIGSSLARVMLAENLSRRIVASTRSEKTLQDALELGLIEQGFNNPIDAVQGADLVVLPTCASHRKSLAINSAPFGRQSNSD